MEECLTQPGVVKIGFPEERTSDRILMDKWKSDRRYEMEKGSQAKNAAKAQWHTR